MPLIDFFAAQKLSFSTKQPRFLKKFNFQANLAKNSNSYVFETIFVFCSSIKVDVNKTFQISIIHDNFYLGLIPSPKVTIGTLIPRPKKLKISGEGYL